MKLPVPQEHPISIRRAMAEDAPALTRLAIASKASWGYSPEWMAQAAVYLQLSPEYIARNPVYTAQSEVDLVGWYALLLRGEIAWLDNLWVAAGFFGRGIGRRLFTHAVEIAHLAGAARLALESDPHAVGFYLRMGMKVTGESISEMGRRLPLMGMELQVTL
jgi:ribosomal protein S18 acetylase RimI-like enzyme